MQTVNIEMISPAIAQEYLKRNIKNRRVRPQTVASYARDMRNKKFYVTNQGIGFDEDGMLVDGQHRLLAVIASGETVQMQVTRGLNAEAVAAIDRGVSRSISDVFSVQHRFDSGDDANVLTDKNVISTISALANLSTNRRDRISVSDCANLYGAFKNAVDIVYHYIIRDMRRRSAPSTAAAVAAISCGVDPVAVARFFRVVFKDDITGCDDYNVNAALSWARRYRESKGTASKREVFLGTQNAIYHFVNNTDVSVMKIPSSPRYEVSEKVNEVMRSQSE